MMASNQFPRNIFILAVTLTIVQCAPNNIGFLNGISGDSQVKVCAAYATPSQPLPTDENQAESYPLKDWTSFDFGCDQEVFNESMDQIQFQSSLDSRIVAVKFNNCLIVEMAKFAQDRGAKGLLVVVHSKTDPPSLEVMRKYQVTIPVGVVAFQSFKKIQDLGERVSVKEYSYPHQFYMEYATLILWIVAVASIALGTLWDQYVYLPLNGSEAESSYEVNGKELDEREKNLSINGEKEAKKAAIAENNKKLGLSIIKAVVFLIVMTVIQVLLYFYYNVVIYIIYGLFFFITVLPTFSLLQTFKCFMPCCSYELNCGKRAIDVRNVILFLVAVMLYIIWIIYRLESFSWVFQDLLVLFAIIRVTGRLHMYDLKVCVIMLVLLTIYFTFILFGTSAMTSEGKSILEVIIAGKGAPETSAGREKLPMTLRFPQLTSDPLSYCFHRESGISLVDVIVPGGVVAYCYMFGSKVGSRFVYFFTSLSGFGLGAGMNFLVQYLTSHPQPVLLYVSPCLLIPVIVLSIIRREFNEFWNGRPEEKGKTHNQRKQYDQVAQNETNI